MCERKIFGKKIWFTEERKDGTEKEENNLGKENVTMCDRQTHRQNCEDRARILDSEFIIPTIHNLEALTMIMLPNYINSGSEAHSKNYCRLHH